MEETTSSKKTTQSGYKQDLNPTKLFARFLFRALILAVLCSLVPVFLSKTPELANQTRLLELLHLVFVGIAISYGLFSLRNYDEEGDGGSSNIDYSKADHPYSNSHSYVPKIPEVSSVFNVNHESESEPSADYKSPPTKFRVSSERRKSSEQKIKFDDHSAKRNSPKKVWLSDPIVESKEQDTEENDRRSFLGSKAAEESKDEEHRQREHEIHEDDDEKKIEEEGVSGSDVDKKADVFIAKVREQIRLERIESIKRSSIKISAD